MVPAGGRAGCPSLRSQLAIGGTALSTALVGVGEFGRQVPVLCYELLPGTDAAAVEPQLRALAARHRPLAGIGHYLRHPAFPVDIRHNAKIGREKLAAWAAAQLAKDSA